FGVVMEKFNWFGDDPAGNTYRSDVRMPASLVALCAPTGVTPPQLAALVGAWSEPPLGVIGLNLGTPAAYARPFQHVHCYDTDEGIVKLSRHQDDADLPTFTNLWDATERGAVVDIRVGPDRAMLAEKGPPSFYQVLLVETSYGHPKTPARQLL